MMIEIKHYITGELLYKSDLPSLEQAVEQATKEGADLSGADLTGANLRGADLTGAHFRGAHFTGAHFTGAYLRGADLRGANFTGAYLRGANFTGAYLRGADLRGANFTGAYLRGADLRGADLTGAYLRGADFAGAKGINEYLTTALFMLLHQPGKIRLGKLVKANGEGPYNGGIKYEIGGFYEELNANIDKYEHCGAGINVATFDWCIKEWQSGYKILLAEFEAKDIACIPVGSDGKVRLFRCNIVGEMDLSVLGLADKCEGK